MMKEHWSVSKEKLVSLEEGTTLESTSTGLKVVRDRRNTCKSVIQYVKLILYLEFALLVGWGCYSLWQTYRIESMEVTVADLIGKPHRQIVIGSSRDEDTTKVALPSAIEDVDDILPILDKLFRRDGGVLRQSNGESRSADESLITSESATQKQQAAEVDEWYVKLDTTVRPDNDGEFILGRAESSTEAAFVSSADESLSDSEESADSIADQDNVWHVPFLSRGVYDARGNAQSSSSKEEADYSTLDSNAGSSEEVGPEEDVDSDDESRQWASVDSREGESSQEIGQKSESSEEGYGRSSHLDISGEALRQFKWLFDDADSSEEKGDRSSEQEESVDESKSAVRDPIENSDNKGSYRILQSSESDETRFQKWLDYRQAHSLEDTLNFDGGIHSGESYENSETLRVLRRWKGFIKSLDDFNKQHNIMTDHFDTESYKWSNANEDERFIDGDYSNWSDESGLFEDRSEFAEDLPEIHSAETTDKPNEAHWPWFDRTEPEDETDKINWNTVTDGELENYSLSVTANVIGFGNDDFGLQKCTMTVVKGVKQPIVCEPIDNANESSGIDGKQNEHDNDPCFLDPDYYDESDVEESGCLPYWKWDTGYERPTSDEHGKPTTEDYLKPSDEGNTFRIAMMLNDNDYSFWRKFAKDIGQVEDQTSTELKSSESESRMFPGRPNVVSVGLIIDDSGIRVWDGINNKAADFDDQLNLEARLRELESGLEETRGSANVVTEHDQIMPMIFEIENATESTLTFIPPQKFEDLFGLYDDQDYMVAEAEYDIEPDGMFGRDANEEWEYIKPLINENGDDSGNLVPRKRRATVNVPQNLDEPKNNPVMKDFALHNLHEDAATEVQVPKEPSMNDVDFQKFVHKMEFIAAHIDRLHKRYLHHNKLNDDYISMELPAEDY